MNSENYMVIGLGIIAMIIMLFLQFHYIIDIANSREDYYKSATRYGSRISNSEQQILDELDKTIKDAILFTFSYFLICLAIIFIGVWMKTENSDFEKATLQSESEQENNLNLERRQSNFPSWRKGVNELRKQRRIKGEETSSSQSEDSA